MLPGLLVYPTATRRYIGQATQLRSPGSRKTFESHLRLLQNRFPGKRVNEITTADLRAFLTLEPDGRPSRHASSTVRNRRATLQSFFGWASDEHLCSPNPAEPLQRLVNVRHRRVKSHTWLTPEEVQGLLRACDEDPAAGGLLGARDALALSFGLMMGLRRAEIASLRWGDLSLRSSRLSWVGKGDKPAVAAVPGPLVERLIAWRSLREAAAGSPLPTDPVLVRFWLGPNIGELAPAWSTPLGVDGVYGLVQRRGRQIGIADLRPHDLRRSFAGLLEDSGVSLRDIQQVMRHANLATTDTYLGTNPGRAADAVDAAVVGILSRRGA